MSKYYKEEDLQRALSGFIRETGIDEKPYEYAVNVLDSLSALNIVPCEECKRAPYCEQELLKNVDSFGGVEAWEIDFCQHGITKEATA